MTVKPLVFKVEFSKYIPEDKVEGILYISREYETAVHLCPCGCGAEIPIPITEDPREINGIRNPWYMSIPYKNVVTISPSLLNRECGAHYFITQNKVIPT